MSINLEMIIKDEYLRENKEIIKKIYDKLADAKSKEMYEAALNFIATRDYSYLIKIHELNSIKSDQTILQQDKYCKLHAEGKKIIFYGLGERTETMVQLWKKYHSYMGYEFAPFITDIPVTWFCDKNYKEYQDGYLGKIVLSPDDLEKYKDEIIIINTKVYFDEIRNELLKKGFREDHIFFQEYSNSEVYEERQYFEQFMKSDHETMFVDAGCYDGKTTHTFVEWQSDYASITAFEPDKANFTVCQQNMKNIKHVNLINAGVGIKNEKRVFSASADQASHIDDKGSEVVDIVKLDDVIGTRSVSFIKMDVEGAELEALMGGSQSITTNLPKLAISAYHKRYDLIDIPKYILQLSEKYNFYLRIYSNNWQEWVLYAIAEQD